MPPLTTDALVLRTFPLGEMSVVVVLLTRSKGNLLAVDDDNAHGSPAS